MNAEAVRVRWLERAIDVALLAAIVVCVAARVHRLSIPLERDEGEYAYIAQLMLDGVPPYRECFTMKLPGVPALYALAFVLLKQTAFAAHVAGLAADVVSVTALAWFSTKTLATTTRATAWRLSLVIAASWFAITSTMVVEGFEANCEKFAVAFEMLALVVIARVVTDIGERALRRSIALSIACGAALGCAYVCKQQSAPFVVALAVAAFINAHTHWRRKVALSIACAAGTLLPIAIVVVAVVAGGTFDAFKFQTITYASAYLETSRTPLRFLAQFATSALAAPPFVLGVVAVPAAFVVGKRDQRVWLAALTIAGFGSASIGLLFRPHYFVYAIPALCYAIVVVAAALRSGVRNGAGRVVVVVAAGACIVVNRGDMFLKRDNDVLRHHYAQDTFGQSQGAASYIAKHTNRDTRIFVLGAEPQILFYAHRRSVTPYVYLYPLFEPQPYAWDQRVDVMKAVDAAAPRFIVARNKIVEWLPGLRGIGAWSDELFTHYDEVWPHERPLEFDAKGHPKLSSEIVVLERRGE